MIHSLLKGNGIWSEPYSLGKTALPQSSPGHSCYSPVMSLVKYYMHKVHEFNWELVVHNCATDSTMICKCQFLASEYKTNSSLLEGKLLLAQLYFTNKENITPMVHLIQYAVSNSGQYSILQRKCTEFCRCIRMIAWHWYILYENKSVIGIRSSYCTDHQCQRKSQVDIKVT